MRIFSYDEADEYHQLILDKNRIDLVDMFDNGVFKLPFRYLWVEDDDDINDLAKFILVDAHKYIIQGKLLIPFCYYFEDGMSDFNLLETQTIFLKDDLKDLLINSGAGFELILIDKQNV